MPSSDRFLILEADRLPAMREYADVAEALQTAQQRAQEDQQRRLLVRVIGEIEPGTPDFHDLMREGR